MTIFEKKTFSHQKVAIDGNTYDACHFDHCEIVYGGGELPRMSATSFVGAKWILEGAAARTLAFMRATYGMEGMADFYETHVFDLIRGKDIG